jgi:hypothetical protein
MDKMPFVAKPQLEDYVESNSETRRFAATLC